MRAGHDIFEDRHVLEHADVLKGARESERGAAIRGKPLDPAPREPNGAFAGGQKAGDHIEGCRLTRAIWADEAVDLALGNAEVETVDGYDAAETNRERPDGKKWGCSH